MIVYVMIVHSVQVYFVSLPNLAFCFWGLVADLILRWAQVLLNNDPLVLRRLSFTPAVPIGVQAAAVHSCDVLMGVHGAGLTHVVSWHSFYLGWGWNSSVGLPFQLP